MSVPVSLVLNLVAKGQTPKAIIEDYPYLEPEDIQRSLQYAGLQEGLQQALNGQTIPLSQMRDGIDAQ